MSVGVFDSGLGGLTILNVFRTVLPDQSFVYFGDNQNTPYGEKQPGEVYDLTIAGVKKLFDLGFDLVILACNTASAVDLHDLQVNWLQGERRVLGVFVPMIEDLTSRDWGDNTPPTHTGLHDVALFATPATIASGAFARELKFRARDVTVFGQACDGLVEAIEAADEDRIEDLVARHVGKVLERLPVPQSAVLGCTHYPLLEDVFRKYLPEETRLISQPEIVAASLADYLKRHPRFTDQSGGVRHITTGNSSTVSASAQKLMGLDVTFGPA